MPADPKLYREMSKSRPSRDDANGSLDAFYAAVAEARKANRVANAVVVASVPYDLPDGDEADATVTFSFGDSGRAQALAAFAHGFLQREHVETIAAIIARGKRRRPDK